MRIVIAEIVPAFKGISDKQVANAKQALDKLVIYHGTDVLAVEPMEQNHPYFSIQAKDRLLLTPHTAWASIEARKTLLEMVAKNIESASL